MTRVDVVIVAYRSRDVIEDCLHAALAIPRLGVIVVVDHGQDGVAAVARQLGATVLEDPSNPGFAAGQNRGVAMTQAPFVLLLNPDAVIRPAGVQVGAEFLELAEDVAAVQGVIVTSRGGAERSQGAELGPVHLLGRAVGARRLLRMGLARHVARRVRAVADHVDRVPDEPRDVEALAATAVLLRRAAFDAVGGFDTSYFLYGEDLDLCRRLRLAG